MRRRGVSGQLRADLAVQGGDLAAGGGQDGDQGGVRRRGRLRSPLAPRGAPGGGRAAPAVLVAAVVALLSQVASRWATASPRGVLGVEPGQERQADRGVEDGEQWTGPGNTFCRWARSWLAAATRWVTRSLRTRVAERSAIVAGLIAGHRSQPASVGADHVGQHVGVEPVVLVPGRPVPRPQVLHLPWRDHEHGQPARQQRRDHRAIATFDADLGHCGLEQPGGHALEPGRVVGHREPVGDLALIADHADDVVVLGPVHPRRDTHAGQGRTWGRAYCMAVPRTTGNTRSAVVTGMSAPTPVETLVIDTVLATPAGGRGPRLQ